MVWTRFYRGRTARAAMVWTRFYRGRTGTVLRQWQWFGLGFTGGVVWTRFYRGRTVVRQWFGSGPDMLRGLSCAGGEP
jgi:hypothetical protein